MEITKEEFKEYLNVQMSGKTNMFNISEVINLSNVLDREKVLFIMDNYGELSEKYLKWKHLKT